jgi:polysaccharide export outer membrane protein
MGSASQRPRHRDGEIRLIRDDGATALAIDEEAHFKVEVEMKRKQPTEGRAFSLMLVVFMCLAPTVTRAQAVRTLSASTTTARTADSASTQPDGDQPELHRRNPRYKVQHSDTLSITFPLSPDFDQAKAVVQPDGYINLQGTGSVHIEGMTVPEVVDAVKKAYAGILHEPIVEVDLVDFQKPFFLVSGQVGKPGEYELRHETTITEAIAMAGGFAPTAKTQVFFYHRVSPDWVEVKQFNVKEILHGTNENEDARLSSGDMIFVPKNS